MAVLVQEGQRLVSRRRHDLHRGHRALGDDPADHHLGIARGVPPDPTDSDRSSPSARGDEMGSGADDRAALRSQRCHCGVDAGPGACPG
ncbi:hypothetical protein MMMB2_2939 [Mycobacterium marinum MB2]|nr:hypothetical protein MMMB2_2939 [Mycobacterium marinum MB2]